MSIYCKTPTSAACGPGGPRVSLALVAKVIQFVAAQQHARHLGVGVLCVDGIALAEPGLLSIGQKVHRALSSQPGLINSP